MPNQIPRVYRTFALRLSGEFRGQHLAGVTHIPFPIRAGGDLPNVE